MGSEPRQLASDRFAGAISSSRTKRSRSRPGATRGSTVRLQPRICRDVSVAALALPASPAPCSTRGVTQLPPSRRARQARDLTQRIKTRLFDESRMWLCVDSDQLLPFGRSARATALRRSSLRRFREETPSYLIKRKKVCPPRCFRGGLLYGSAKWRLLEAPRRALRHRRAVSALPDVSTLVWREIQRLAGLDVEGRIPSVHIAHHAVDPEAFGRVRIDH